MKTTYHDSFDVSLLRHVSFLCNRYFEMGGAISTNGGRRGMHIGYWWESQNERDHWEDQDVGGWTILKWTLERYDGVVWTGIMRLRIGASGGLL
jgi:hypothetical protein